MLPHFKTTAITLVTALSIALTAAAPASAWGRREQDTLKGAVGAAILLSIINDANNKRRAAPVYREQPIYREEPAPRHHGHAKPRRDDRGHSSSQNSIYNTPVARAFNSYSSSERRLIQRRLAHWGYYRGGMDGSFGPGTYSAISAYASDKGHGRSLGTTAGAFEIFDRLIY